MAVPCERECTNYEQRWGQFERQHAITTSSRAAVAVSSSSAVLPVDRRSSRAPHGNLPWRSSQHGTLDRLRLLRGRHLLLPYSIMLKAVQQAQNLHELLGFRNAAELLMKTA